MSKKSGTLTLIRHTESEWNALGTWTGLTDVNLSEKGHKEAEEIGKLVHDMHFDIAFLSEQKRTHQTFAGIVRGSGKAEPPTHIHAAVNERDYGDLTGKDKWQVKEAIGDVAFNGIRRGWDHPVPGGETLKDVHERIVPFYLKELVPRLLDGDNVLLVAHGNSLRALLKYIEDTPEADIAHVEMPIGKVISYQINQEGRVLHKTERAIVTGPTKA